MAKRPQHPENPTLGRCGLLAEVGKLDVRHLPQNHACQRCPSQRFREDLATAQLQRQVEHRRSRRGMAAHTRVLPPTSTLGLRPRKIEPLTSLLLLSLRDSLDIAGEAFQRNLDQLTKQPTDCGMHSSHVAFAEGTFGCECLLLRVFELSFSESVLVFVLSRACFQSPPKVGSYIHCCQRPCSSTRRCARLTTHRGHWTTLCVQSSLSCPVWLCNHGMCLIAKRLGCLHKLTCSRTRSLLVTSTSRRSTSHMRTVRRRKPGSAKLAILLHTVVLGACFNARLPPARGVKTETETRQREDGRHFTN